MGKSYHSSPHAAGIAQYYFFRPRGISVPLAAHIQTMLVNPLYHHRRRPFGDVADGDIQFYGHRCGVDMQQLFYDHFRDSGGRLVMIMSHTHIEDAVLGNGLFSQMSIPIMTFRKPNGVARTMRRLFPNWWQRHCDSNGNIEKLPGISNTNRIVQALHRRRGASPTNGGGWCLLISMSGGEEDNETPPSTTDTTIDNSEAAITHKHRIRHGYFHVAQQTGSRIIVVGFDYLTRRCHVSKRSWTPTEGDDVTSFSRRHESEILAELGDIYPATPRRQIGFNAKTYFQRWPTRRLPSADFDVRKHHGLRYMVQSAIRDAFSTPVVAVTVVAVVLLLLMVLMLPLLLIRRQLMSQ